MSDFDKEIEKLLEKKAKETWSNILEQKYREMVKPVKKISTEDIIKKMKEITKGERAEEIIDKAYTYYGDTAISIFKRIIQLHEEGVIRELYDYELYQILQKLGLRIPIETKVRIVRHGREYRIGEEE